MAQIRFNVKPISDKKMQIRAVFQDGKEQKTKNLGETIPANKLNNKYKYWDQTNEIVRGLPAADRINALISKWKSRFTQYKDDCKRDKENIDLEIFIKSLSSDQPIKKENTIGLVSITEQFLASIKASHDNKTYKGYNVLLHHLQAYETHTGKPILIENIDRQWYKAFAHYLMSEQTNHNAVINRKQGRICTILSFAARELKIRGINPDYQQFYKLKQPSAPKFPLTNDELATLHALTLDNEYHTMVLSAFLLACETGLRHSDIIQLKPAHIQSHVTPEGIIKFITLTNIKTDRINTMPLSDRAMAIVNKYLSHPEMDRPGFSFHYSQAAGKVLKTIFENADLNRPCEVVKMQGSKTTRKQLPLHKVISFHMARNTYITRLLRSNVAPVFVQQNAGHSKLETTMGYYRNEDAQRMEETLKALKN